MGFGKELWLKAEEEFIKQFHEARNRDPTKEEVRTGMKDFLGDYLGDLIDDTTEKMKEK